MREFAPVIERVLLKSSVRIATRLVTGVSLAMVAVITVLASVGPMVAARAGATSLKAPDVFYLDIGASISVGVQPTTATPSGRPTLHGYANDLVALAAARGLSLQLTELGCPGETLATMVSGADGCYHGTDSQLSDAVAFLRSHTHQVGIVTVDLGYNTFQTCFKGKVSITTCAAQMAVVVRRQLTGILKNLKAAAGPHVTFIGVGHYDPFLASYLGGPRGRSRAAASLLAFNLFNQSLRDTYRAFAIPMANIARAFNANALARVRVPGLGPLPENVARICTLTWMCHRAPYGPNIHPNDWGYHLMARAILALLPATTSSH